MVSEELTELAKEATDSAADASGNMETVPYFLETENTGRAIQQIEWAIGNSKLAMRYMEQALAKLKQQ